MSNEADIKFYPNQMVEIIGPSNVSLVASNTVSLGNSNKTATVIVNGQLQVEKSVMNKEDVSCSKDVSITGSLSVNQIVNTVRLRSSNGATSPSITIVSGSLIIRDAQNKPKLQISSNGDILSLGGDITLCGGDLILEQTSDVLFKMPNGEVVSLRNRLNL